MKDLKKFLEKKSEKNKIIVIYWPTACGKTDLAIKIAKFLNSEMTWYLNRKSNRRGKRGNYSSYDWYSWTKSGIFCLRI